MSLVASIGIRTATLEAWRSALAGGALLCCQGTQPADTTTATNPADVLATVPLQAGTIAAAGGNVTLTYEPDPALAAAPGVVGWVRAVSATGVAVFDMDAGPPGVGATAVITGGVSLVAGGEVDVLLALSL